MPVGLNWYSLEKEVALGRQLAEEVERQAKMLDDPLVGEYVNRIGQNLARQSAAPVVFTFKVIRSNELNAFALPGGFVFVNTGLIKMCDDEAELAAALAHEVAHVAARHMTRQATRTEMARLGSVPIAILLGGHAGAAARNASSIGIPLSLLSFGRRDEERGGHARAALSGRRGLRSGQLHLPVREARLARTRQTRRRLAHFPYPSAQRRPPPERPARDPGDDRRPVGIYRHDVGLYLHPGAALCRPCRIARFSLRNRNLRPPSGV